MTTGKFGRRQFLVAALGTALSQASLHSVLAQSSVVRPARMLVGFPAGGAIDTVGRLLVEQMRDYAPSLIVENRAGAGGRLALDSLKRSEPDGSTFAITPGDQITLFPHIYKSLPYEPLRDFVPVTTVCAFPFAFVVGSMVPPDVRTLADFAAWCRANPQHASFGSAGAGTRPHFLGTLLARETKTTLTHIPYNGGAPALQAVLGGQIPLAVTVLANALPQLQAGTLRALAISAPRRSALLPDVATASEAGFAGVEAIEWFGIFLPASTPPNTVNDLRAAIEKALASPQVKAGLAKQAFEPFAVHGDAFAKLIREDTDRWQKVVAEAGFKPLD
jgi:tripartite-type tricarboxylate transporter receptor subunit TctC